MHTADPGFTEHDGLETSAGWGAFLAWDGSLPLIVAAFPVLVERFLPGEIAAQILVSVFIPIAAAFVRCVIGARQIRQRCHGELPALRQVAMAGAILLLLFFEASVAALTFAKDEPLLMWLLPVGLYLAYLVVLALALIRAE